MPTDHRAKLATIKRFDQLIAYLRDEMGWPISRDSFESVDDLFYDFSADELGIDPRTAAKIQEIKRLRPLSAKQPWGIFFVKFEPKKLPVIALRRILSQVALKKRASANSADRAAWAVDDLLFVSNYGEGDERQISFAHFSRSQDGHDLPTLKVLGWDNRDTALHLDAVVRELTQHLVWPADDRDANAWRERWRAAFTVGHREVVTTSKELSIRLAELARAIRDRIKTAIAIETEKGPLTQLMKAFQTALVHDLDSAGFADMYAQTIAYGLLSARITDPHRKTADDFAAHMRTNPFLRELMETFLKVGGRRGKAGGPGIDFDELGVSEVVELLDIANMEAVVLDFGDRNPQEDPVIHFYEHFLAAYDKEQKVSRGVFYTPRPVVSYIVRSVDDLLRTKFALDDGLADTTTWGEMVERHKGLTIPKGVSPEQDFVQILDPATGTGTFLVEVIEVVHKTLVAKWRVQGHGDKKIEALWNDYVPKHLLPRLHGYELLMAPYAIAHLKVGLKLYETGYRFGSDVRARIFLTNTLEPAEDFSGTLEFAIPALAHEAHAVNDVKRNQRFTAVIGNPPYSLYSSNLTPAARQLIQPYRFVDGQRIKERGALQLEKNLQDDYVKFFAFAEASLGAAGTGLLSFISNSGYMANRSLRGMRAHLLLHFDKAYVVDLHGSLSRTAKNQAKDENVFDIVQGVSICLMVDSPTSARVQTVKHASVRGLRSEKYNWLAAATISTTDWNVLSPAADEFFLIPFDTTLREEYLSWPSIDQLMPLNSSGMVTARDAITIWFDEAELHTFAKRFARLPVEQARSEYELGPDTKDWSVERAQADIRSQDTKSSVARVLYRPFDWRFTLYSGQARGFLCNPRRPVLQNMVGERNIGILVNRQVNNDFNHALITRSLIDTCTLSSATRETAYIFPLLVGNSDRSESAGLFEDVTRANMAGSLVKMAMVANGLRMNRGRNEPVDTATQLGLSYMYSVLHSRQYRSKYREFLRVDFPRIPIATNPAFFQHLSELGAELIGLHLFESPKVVERVTTYVGNDEPEVIRVGWSDNTVWLDAQSARKGERAKPGKSGFLGVLEDVWLFHVGGYQVCEKWLKDRKGRVLSKDDVAHYQKIVVVLSETIRLMKEIDEVIAQHGGWPDAFQTEARVVQERPLLKVAEPTATYDAGTGQSKKAK